MMKMTQLSFLFVASIVFSTQLSADSWMSPGSSLTTDAAGRFYVIINKTKSWKAEFLYCEKASESKPLVSVQRSAKDIAPRKGDTVLCKGKFSYYPYKILVPRSGCGFVALDTYGHLGSGVSLATISLDGKVLQQQKLGDLFTFSEIRKLPRSVSSTWWLKGEWFDEKEKKVVLVLPEQRIKIVPFAGGKAEPAGDDLLLRSLLINNPMAQSLSLDLLREKKNGKGKAQAKTLFKNPGLPMGIRVRAAAYLATFGDSCGKKLYRDFLRMKDPTPRNESREFAVRNSKVVLGSSGIPLLVKLLQGDASVYFGAARDALESYGKEAMTALLEMVIETDGSQDSRGSAAGLLGKIGDMAAVGVLEKLVEDSSEYVANHAVNALIAISAPKLADSFIKFLHLGTTQDMRIAMYFSKVRHPLATAALKAAEKRVEKTSHIYRIISEALDYQK